MDPNKKKVILITEDEQSLLKILADSLIEQNYETIQAKNGHEGLLQAREHHPDLILVDLLMPQMDGLTMINKLREDQDWGLHVPVIILTNVSPDSDATLKAVMQYQPAYYFMKSNIQIDELSNKIKEVLYPPVPTP